MAFSKTIQLYIFDGNPYRRIMCELSNWNGRVYKIARNEIAAFSRRADSDHTGVYFLLGKNEENRDTVYIGEAEKVATRLKQHAHKHHWLKTIGGNPDDIFGKVQMSYLDYYYKLFFDLRNPSAHSYGNVHYDLLRKQAVEAQCFAAIIVREYIRTNILDEEQAIDSLNFNRDLLARVSENMSTKITK